MPKFTVGDMWTSFDQADRFCITTNSYLRTNGALVMGRGIAKTARDRFPGIDLDWGQHILRMGLVDGVYGLLMGSKASSKLVAFQVKTHYRYQADPKIIQKSAILLASYARANPDHKIALNYPGIGYGRLATRIVAPLLEVLPDNVTVWVYDKGD